MNCFIKVWSNNRVNNNTFLILFFSDIFFEINDVSTEDWNNYSITQLKMCYFVWAIEKIAFYYLLFCFDFVKFMNIKETFND